MKRAGVVPWSKWTFALACAIAVLPVGGSRLAAAQTTSLQTNAATSLSCAPSQNGTGHMICGEERKIGAGNTLFGGVSWQAHPTTTGAPGTEADFTVNQSNTTMPTGNLTGTPGCTSTNDGSGFVVCAVEGPNNGLYGIGIRPQPTQSTTALMPLLLPGTVITAGINPTAVPCTPAAPCNIVTSLSGQPSCAPTSEKSASNTTSVICAVVANVQSVHGAARQVLVGVAFDPRIPQAAGSNPAVAMLPYTPTFFSNPSCVGVIDHNTTTPQNGGKEFAACGITVMGPAPWSTATIFGIAFDPRSGYARGGLIINSASDFSTDPSCATPRDGTSEVLCAVGTGDGSAFGSGTASTLSGFGFDPIGRTTTSVVNLGAAPAGAGFWTGVSCASPNVTSAQNTTLCAATTSANRTYGVLFDPRTTAAPRISAARVFSPPTGATMPARPSCISLNIVNNQISCGIVDSNNQSWAFAVPAP